MIPRGAFVNCENDKIRAMNDSQKIDTYIHSLPQWQQDICNRARQLIHKADPDIAEEIKFTNRPYFTHKGNVCALLAAKQHVNVFIYDPIAPDPQGIINQGHGNQTARAIQITEGNFPDERAFVELIRAVVANNEKGGWRKLKK
jgi:hypothetical protein